MLQRSLYILSLPGPRGRVRRAQSGSACVTLRSGERNESSSLPPILYFAWQRYFNTNVHMNLKG